MFDAETLEHLGCSGEYEGLSGVDRNDVTYRVDAWFRDPSGDFALEPWILNGRTVELVVSEDDDGRCPEPPGSTDDMIGISGPIDRAMVEGGPMLSFDRVMGIRLVIE
jgi:hypothetical protein